MSRAAIDICFCCDRHAVDGLAAVLISAAQCLEAECSIHAYVIDLGLGEQNLARLQTTAATRLKNVTLTFVPLAPARLAHFPAPAGLKHPSKATYAKLLLAELLPALDRVLYLDCDLLVTRNLAELFHTSIDGAPFAAVPDTTVANFGSDVENLRTQLPEVSASTPYCNAGVLLLDLARLRALGAVDRFARFTARHGAKFGDQTLWNAAFPGQWHPLSAWWNIQLFLLPEFNVFPTHDRAIWHFTRDHKPWHFARTRSDGLVLSWHQTLESAGWPLTCSPKYTVAEPRWKTLLKRARSRWQRRRHRSSP